MDVAGRRNGDAEGPHVDARGGWGDATAAATANPRTAGWGGGVWRRAGAATPLPRRHPPPSSLPASLVGRAASAQLPPRPAAASLLLPADWAVARPGRLPPVPPPPRPAAAVDIDGGGAGGAAGGGRLPPAAGVTMADLAAALGVAAACLRATRSPPARVAAGDGGDDGGRGGAFGRGDGFGGGGADALPAAAACAVCGRHPPVGGAQAHRACLCLIDVG